MAHPGQLTSGELDKGIDSIAFVTEQLHDTLGFVSSAAYCELAGLLGKLREESERRSETERRTRSNAVAAHAC